MATSRIVPSLEQRLAASIPSGKSAVMYQSWRHLLFMHWKVEPSAVQAMLPPGLTLDLFEGEAYVGIVPFFMCGVRPRFLPCVAGLSDFLELNVRTYVHDDQGVPGVWFFSLDANCVPAVWLAQTLFRLPYRHAKMRAAVAVDGWVDYSSCCEAGKYDGRFHYRGVGESRESVPGSLDFFLLERYYLYAYHGGRKKLYRGQVAHERYRFRSAEVDAYDLNPMTQQGLMPIEDQDCHRCVAEEVKVKILGLECVG